jgi:hypothetical protein
MKARVKDTGEVFRVLDLDSERILIKYGSEVKALRLHEVDLIPESEEGYQKREIDWEQRRYEIAKEAMSGILSDENCVGYASVAAEYSENEKHTYPKAVSRYAVACADALIAELKGGEE